MNSTNSRALRPEIPAQTVLASLDAKPKRRRDRAAKQRALVQAALKLFAHKGYEATTTREIAACAGCAEGLIHRYFSGKAGLLPALIEHRVSKELADLGHEVQPAAKLEKEFLQLVNWEVERMWEDREFLSVFIPHALLDPALGNVMYRAVTSQRANVILKRLERFEQCRRLARDEIEALAQSVGVLAFVFGFMRPQVLRQEREPAKAMAATLARILVRSL